MKLCSHHRLHFPTPSHLSRAQTCSHPQRSAFQHRSRSLEPGGRRWKGQVMTTYAWNNNSKKGPGKIFPMTCVKKPHQPIAQRPASIWNCLSFICSFTSEVIGSLSRKKAVGHGDVLMLNPGTTCISWPWTEWCRWSASRSAKKLHPQLWRFDGHLLERRAGYLEHGCSSAPGQRRSCSRRNDRYCP